jgi:hypothetical protein
MALCTVALVKNETVKKYILYYQIGKERLATHIRVQQLKPKRTILILLSGKTRNSRIDGIGKIMLHISV